MGRKKKYLTETERKFANNTKVKEFYWKNKRKLDLDASIRYWNKKLVSMEITGIEMSHPRYIKAKSKLTILVSERNSIIEQSDNIQ